MIQFKWQCPENWVHITLSKSGTPFLYVPSHDLPGQKTPQAVSRSRKSYKKATGYRDAAPPYPAAFSDDRQVFSIFSRATASISLMRFS